MKNDYEFFKVEAVTGMLILILTITFTFILYNTKIYMFMYCLSFYILSSEICMIYFMKKTKENEDYDFSIKI